MIGLMDCNNFFVSCERLFRPDLIKKPVAVLSSNDGCIVARSQEVKDLGIPMGIPYFEVKDICSKHHVTLFSSNFPLYRDLSRRVMLALREEFGHIQIYSIDEAFFEVPLGFTVDDIREVRERIIAKTGIPVSFGLAPTKTIAKIANTEAKKGDGVTWLTSPQAQERYTSITCGSVWGIGRQISKRLSTLGVSTVREFLERGLPFARQEFGVVGERLFFELSGTRTDCEDEESTQASVSSTRSFRKTVTDEDVLLSALGHHITHIGEKLRERNVMATELSIICAPSRFGSFVLQKVTARRILEAPTNDTGVLLHEARALFSEVYAKGVPYKKAGATVSGLIPVAYVSPTLFDTKLSRENSTDTVYEVVDMLNERFGRGTVHPGTVMRPEDWAPNSRARSQEYTTRWSDIAHVKAI